MKKIFNVGNICLFLAALLVTVATAVIVNVCGGDKLSVVMASAFAGIIGTLALQVSGRLPTAQSQESSALSQEW